MKHISITGREQESDMKSLFAVSLMAAMTGCASVSPLPDQAMAPSTPVTIVRSAQLQGSVTDTYIGWNGDYYVALAPGQATTVTVPAGLTTFRIRAHADLRNELALSLHPGEPVCLMAEVNPANIAGVNWLVPGYQLRQIQCADSHGNSEHEVVAAPAEKPMRQIKSPGA
jgi:hypothetical protein